MERYAAYVEGRRSVPLPVLTRRPVLNFPSTLTARAISSVIAPALPANTGKQWQKDEKRESG